MSFSLSHSSRASMTMTTCDVSAPVSSLDRGSTISTFHWSRRVLLTIPSFFDIAFCIGSLRTESLASCTAIVVTNFPACLTSSSSLEKKKLAPRHPRSQYSRAIVRAIVDFPVPAHPLSQKKSLPSSPSAHFFIRSRTSTRVLGRQRGSSSFPEALNSALVA
jgi:hypothetical protein